MPTASIRAALLGPARTSHRHRAFHNSQQCSPTDQPTFLSGRSFGPGGTSLDRRAASRQGRGCARVIRAVAHSTIADVDDTQLTVPTAGPRPRAGGCTSSATSSTTSWAASPRCSARCTTSTARRSAAPHGRCIRTPTARPARPRATPPARRTKHAQHRHDPNHVARRPRPQRGHIRPYQAAGLGKGRKRESPKA